MRTRSSSCSPSVGYPALISILSSNARSWLLAITVTLLCGIQAHAHPAHETHAEVTWNSQRRCLEVALQIRAIDLQNALAGRKHAAEHDDSAKDPTPKPAATAGSAADSRDQNAPTIDYLRRTFVVSAPKAGQLPLRFLGQELEGSALWLFFEFNLGKASPKATSPAGCRVTNSVLHETLTGQVNTVELIVGEQRKLLTFRRRSPTAVLPDLQANSPQPTWQPPASPEELPRVDTLPDPFQLADGRRVTDKASWRVRRQEIQQMIQHYAYGHLPPRPKILSVATSTQEAGADGKTNIEHITLKLAAAEPRELKLKLAIHTPTNPTRTPMPVIVAEVHRITDGLPCIALCCKRGYAYVQYEREGLDPDQPNVQGPAQQAYPEHDWATLAVWAWGAMRAVDYLETRSEFDLKRIAVTGHSRGGKAALLAGAMDERFALVAPNGSGCGGASCFRATPSNAESLKQITDPKRFGYWFHTRLRWFSDQENRLPFDQHFVKALVAPRALLCTEARQDHWANPKGTRRTSLAARDVYTFLGARDKIGLCYRDGGHDHTLADWARLIEFADWHFYDVKPADQAEFWQSP